MRIVCAIEDPGAANGMVGLREALAAKGGQLEIYATGAARTYAADIGLNVRDLTSLALPIDADAVLVGTSENPDSPVFAVTAAAKDAGIPAFSFVDGPANAEHRFRGTGDDPLFHTPEFLLVSDVVARDAFEALGVAPENIDIVGHPNMDRVRACAAKLEGEGKTAVRARLFTEIDPACPLVLFLAETSDGLDPTAFQRSSAYTLSGRGGSDGRTEICLEETLGALAKAASGAALVLRLHPKNDPADFAPYAGEIDALSFGDDPLEAVFAADLVVGMTSVLLFEAAVMGRPALAVTPRKCEAAWLNSIALGLTRHVCTPDALAASIRDMLTGDYQEAENIDDLVPPGAATRMAAAICRRIKAEPVSERTS